jgi:O-antigen/teichoic acid export membrane protein
MMHLWQRLKSGLRNDDTIAPIAFLMVLPFVLFFAVTLGGYTLLPVDNLFQWEPFRSGAAALGVGRPQNELLSDLILENYVWKRFILDSLKQGELPLWNPYLFAGVPFLAAGQHSALYPLSLLYYVLPLWLAYGWFTALNLGIAGVCMFVFMRTLGLGRNAATFAGVIYQLSGFMLVSVVFQMVIAAAAWLPLILAMCECIIQQRPGLRRMPASAPWAVIGAIAITLHILAGHVEITVYTALVAGLYCAWRLVTVFDLRDWRNDGKAAAKRAAWLLGMALLGAAMGAIQLVPLFELVNTSFRSGRSDFAQVLSYGFPIRYVTQWLMPNFYGNPSQHSYFDWFTWTVQAVDTARGDTAWGIKNYVEGGAYVGILPLILTGMALWAKWRDRRWKLLNELPVWFFAALGVASLLFIFGTRAYAILYYGLPGINQLHSPFRWVFPLTLCLAALGGIGLDWVLNHPEDVCNRVRTRAMRWAGGIVWATAVGLGIGLLAARLLWPQVAPIIRQVAQSADKANPGMGNPALFFSNSANSVLGLVLLLLAAGIWLRLSQKQQHSHDQVTSRKSQLFSYAAIVILAVDLTLAGWGFNPAVDPKLLQYVPDAIKFLQQDTSLWRLTTYEASGQKPLNANAAWHFNLHDIRGYDSIIPRQYVNYMQLIEPQGELPYNRIAPLQKPESLQSPLLDVLGVKYVLTVDEINLPAYKQVYNDGKTRIYQNERALPRAFTLPITSGLLASDFGYIVQKFDPRQYVIVDTSCGITDIGCTVPQAAQPKPANITVYKHNEVWIDVDVTDASWLLLTDSYAEGWRAYIRPHDGTNVDEVEAQIALANGNFRAVRIENTPCGLQAKECKQMVGLTPTPQTVIANPASSLLSAVQDTKSATPKRFTVRLRYSPMSVRIGGLASLLAGVVLLLVGGSYVWRSINASHNLKNQGAAANSQIRQVARNSLVLTGFNLLSRVIDMAFATVVLRALGPTGNGNFTFAVVLVTWFEILMNFGLNTFLIRDVSRDRAHAMRYFYSTSQLRLLLGLATAPLVALVILGYVWLDGIHLDTQWTIVILVFSQIPGSLATGLSALFFAYEKPEVPSALTIVSALVKVIFGAIALLAFGWGIVGLAIVSVITNLVTLVLLVIAAMRVLHLKFTLADLRLNMDEAERKTPKRQIIKEAWPLMVNHLLSTIYWRIDVPLIKAFTRDAAQVGYYGAGYKYVDAFNIIPSLFTQALFPAMSRMAAREIVSDKIDASNAPLARAYVLAVKLLLMVALPLSVMVSFAAPILIDIIGGSAYLPQGAIGLAIVIWHMPIGWINSVTNYALIAAGQQRQLTRAFVGAVAFNIIANMLLIPIYGFIAAAVVTALSELVQLFTFYFYVRRHICVVNWVEVLVKPFLGAGLMAGITFVLAQMGWMGTGMILGLLVYLAVVLGLRTLTIAEQQTLRPLLPARLRV